MDNSGSAFPLITEWRDHNGATLPGLTRRELFAAMAMQGALTSAHYFCVPYHAPTFAKYAVELADALLAELEKEEK